MVGFAVACARSHATALLDLLWPPVCPRCGGRAAVPREIFCESCWSSLSPVRGDAGRGVHAAFSVNALFIEMLAFSKYRRYRRVGLRLAREAAALVSPLPGAVLVPVPLTKTRHRERGFNQAADFARVLGDRTGLRVEERWLRRVRGGTPLAGRPREERAAAIRGAFEAGAAFPGADAPPLFVVDDVVTTGSTRRACQRALEAAGGRVVACVAMGRAFDSRRDASGGTGAGLPGQF